MRLRSLTFKLMLAFLLVGLVGAGLVAAFVHHRTRAEFVRFMLSREQFSLLDDLGRYYFHNQNWQGVDQVLGSEGPGAIDGAGTPLPGTLVDASGTVILSSQPDRVGSQVAVDELGQGVPIRFKDGVAGWFIFDNLPAGSLPDPGRPWSPEQAFLDRIETAIRVGAVGATLVALVIGTLLARTLTRPLRELTAATRVVAAGKLGHQVRVRSRDELGELARSFNEMSRDLARSNQQRRQMTADIAHDLRTPLSILLGYTEALSDGKLAATAEVHRVMHAEAQHLSRLIDDLRTLSLADAGELTLNWQSCLPYDILARTAAAYQGRAGEKNVSLTVRAGRELPAVTVDPERMAQVLGNLVSNALRYTPAGGQITLAAAAVAGEVALQVADTGSGIAAEDLPHIFNRFYRADQSRQQQNGESGLGLAIAKSMVEAQGGIITVESSPGRGTTFTIRLKPAQERPAPRKTRFLGA